MEPPDLQMAKWMKDHATTQSEGSQFAVTALAVSCLLWRMKQSMHDYLTYQKNQSMKQGILSAKFIICFPHNLPDNEDEDIPWHEETPEEYD